MFGYEYIVEATADKNLAVAVQNRQESKSNLSDWQLGEECSFQWHRNGSICASKFFID